MQSPRHPLKKPLVDYARRFDYARYAAHGARRQKLCGNGVHGEFWATAGADAGPLMVRA